MNTMNWKHYKTALDEVLAGPLPEQISPPSPEGIKTDTREALEGCWFLPLKGAHFDGHQFIEEAFARGAAGAFCELSYKLKTPKDLHDKLIFVTDGLLAIQAVARYIREQNKQTTVFAITGSIGKTSTKNLLASILEATREETLLAPKNFNNELGLPLTLLKLNKKHKYAVLEMGARRIGDIRFLKSIAKPDVNLCLCVGTAHIGTFGSKENIYTGKLEILEKLVKEQKNITLKDDPILLDKALKIDSNCYTYGTLEGADAELISCQPLPSGRTEVTIRLFSKTFKASLAIQHRGLLRNAVAASLMAFLGGVTLEQIKEGLENFYPTESRFKTIKREDFTLIDDSYNSSLESLYAGIDSLTRNYPDKQTACFLGDMHDLGAYSQQYHLELAEFCLKKKLDFIITIGEKTTAAFKEVFLRAETRTKLFHFPSYEDFLRTPLPRKDLGDVLYFKGANSMGLKNIVNHYLSQ